MKSFVFIQSNEELQKEIDNILANDVSVVAIDTEFDRVKTFYPNLSLVQLSYNNRVLVLDCLAIDVEILRVLLESEYIEKVFHSCRQDVEIFFEIYKILPKNIIDLQVIASLLNLGDQVSLGDLSQNIISRKLDKTLQKSSWIERPLSEDKILYAGEDVSAILDVYSLLNIKIDASGIRVWHNCFLNEMIDHFKKSIEERIAEQFNFLGRKGNLLKLRYQAALYIWRERIASKLNKAKNHMLTNKLIEDIALALAHDKKNSIKDLFYKEKHPRALSKTIKKELLEYIDGLGDTNNLPNLQQESEFMSEKHKMIKKGLQSIAFKLNLPLPFLYNKIEISNLLAGNLSLENLPHCKKSILKDFFPYDE